MYNSVYCVGTIYVAFHSHVFYDVPCVLIADARSFQDFRISGFRRHFGLTDTLGLDLKLVSIR